METQSPAVPVLKEIALPVPAIAPETRVQEVIEIFRHDPGLLALPVASEARFTGMINRKNLFFRHLGKPFAADLYKKKPISLLLDEEHHAMEPELDVNSALRRLLQHDPELSTDSFPVVAEGECLGIVSVSDLMMKISETQAALLETLHALSARIREEVAKAREIQLALLPPSEGRVGGLVVNAGVITSSEIGGDFYDYFAIGERSAGFVVGDVSGHGVQSGMVTTAAKASLHTQISRGITDPAELLAGMNDAICATARQSLLMTCLIAVVDLEAGLISVANAGHNYPYRYEADREQVEMLQTESSYPLGFEPGVRYDKTFFAFNAGDGLFLYTDGIVECPDRSGEEFGYERLETILREHMKQGPAAVNSAINRALEEFSGAGAFDDDVTMLTAAAF